MEYSPEAVAGCDHAVACVAIAMVASLSPPINGSVTSPKSSGVLHRVQALVAGGFVV